MIFTCENYVSQFNWLNFVGITYKNIFYEMQCGQEAQNILNKLKLFKFINVFPYIF